MYLAITLFSFSLAEDYLLSIYPSIAVCIYYLPIIFPIEKGDVLFAHMLLINTLAKKEGGAPPRFLTSFDFYLNLFQSFSPSGLTLTPRGDININLITFWGYFIV